MDKGYSRGFRRDVLWADDNKLTIEGYRETCQGGEMRVGKRVRIRKNQEVITMSITTIMLTFPNNLLRAGIHDSRSISSL